MVRSLGFFVGCRYLFSKKSSSFLSFSTFISIAGVAVGVLTLVVTLSVMSGFEVELKKRLFEAQTHILIEGDKRYFELDPSLIEKLQGIDTRITTVSSSLDAEVILKTGQKIAGAELKGVDAAALKWLDKKIIERKPNELAEEGSIGVYIGRSLSYALDLIPGDTITAVSPTATEGAFGMAPKMKRFVVEGIYRTDVPEQEMRLVFTPRGNVERFLGVHSVISKIELKVDDIHSAESVSKKISKLVGDSFLVRSWETLNEHLFQSLRLERITMFCILFFIVIVASFNIISTLTMMVLEKKRSLSILRAIGATRNQIASIFFWESIVIAYLGIGLGLTLGLGVCELLKLYPIIELPDFYYDRTLPVLVNPVTVGVICVVALLIVITASFLPSRKAALISPMDGIRIK